MRTTVFFTVFLFIVKILYSQQNNVDIDYYNFKINQLDNKKNEEAIRTIIYDDKQSLVDYSLLGSYYNGDLASLTLMPFDMTFRIKGYFYKDNLIAFKYIESNSTEYQIFYLNNNVLINSYEFTNNVSKPLLVSSAQKQEIEKLAKVFESYYRYFLKLKYKNDDLKFSIRNIDLR